MPSSCVTDVNTPWPSARPSRSFSARAKEKNPAGKKIAAFRALADQHSTESIKKAMVSIANILETGLDNPAPETYFRGQQCYLKQHLATLGRTSSSLCNSALNLIVLVLACCSVIGISILWGTGQLEANKTTKGSAFMFFAFGERQQAEVLIRETQLSVCSQNSKA